MTINNESKNMINILTQHKNINCIIKMIVCNLQFLLPQLVKEFKELQCPGTLLLVDENAFQLTMYNMHEKDLVLFQEWTVHKTPSCVEQIIDLWVTKCNGFDEALLILQKLDPTITAGDLACIGFDGMKIDYSSEYPEDNSQSPHMLRESLVSISRTKPADMSTLLFRDFKVKHVESKDHFDIVIEGQNSTLCELLNALKTL